MDKGIMLTGGGALLKGLDKLIYSQTHFMHYIYDLTGKLIVVGIFAPINESIWEHLKLAFGLRFYGGLAVLVLILLAFEYV